MAFTVSSRPDYTTAQNVDNEVTKIVDYLILNEKEKKAAKINCLFKIPMSDYKAIDILAFALWNLGKDICRPQNLKWDKCYLRAECKYYNKTNRKRGALIWKKKTQLISIMI